jgi:phosphate transport system substrate-binding protein
MSVVRNVLACAGGALDRALCAVSMLAFAAGLSAAMADTLIVQGSTTFSRRLLEPQQAAIESRAGHKLTVIPNKSTPGLIALLEGRAQMAMISAPLQSEIELLKKSTSGLPLERLRAFEISRTPISVAVHPTNPLQVISRSAVKRILLGEVTNWQALGGPNLPIRIVLVGGGGGVTVAIEAELLKGQAVAVPGTIFVKTPVQLVQVVQQEPGAIGFGQATLVRQRNLPELTVDKPFEQLLALVTLGEPTPAMLSVIDAARAIAAKTM